jgi:hypothetical protein
MKFEIKITEINKEPFVGEDGFDYVRITKKIETPRQTFIKGDISGKYRGDFLALSDQYYNSNFYDFEIYEAIVENAITQKNKPFEDCNENEFPKEKLPQLLKVTIIQLGKYFGVNILEPKLCQFISNKKLHQLEGQEIFGTFNGVISGYILDYEEELIKEIIGPIIGPPPPPPPPTRIKCESNGIKTGKSETDENYIRYEYFCKHHPDTVWGPWKGGGITPPERGGEGNKGCLSSIFTVFGLILGLVFLFAILPSLLYVIPFLLFFLILNLLAPYLKWIVRIIGIVLLFAFISSLIDSFNNGSRLYPKPPLVVDKPRESKIKEEPKVAEETHSTKDTLITRYRNWEDYEGNQFEGEYSLLLSKIKKSSHNKNHLTIASSNERGYDEILYKLKENDKSDLNGLYHLFDSIGRSNKMSKTQFAKMVVCFVQDMPYVLILDKDCDPNLYSDRFIKQFLTSPQAKCIGYQRFGINSPLEFLYSTQGDCDTRTLLLYTIFAHYDYDVALLSSEQYGHSILGINLPINGKAYQYQNQRYVLWETTAPNAKPGFLPNEISNLNYWRISLKSK